MNQSLVTFPHRLQGNRSLLRMGIGVLFFIPGFWNVFLVGLGWEAETLLGEIVVLLFIILNNLFGLYLAHSLVWKHTRYALFDENEILVQWLFRTLRFKTADLESIHLHSWKQQSKNKTITNHGLMLNFCTERPSYLLEQKHFSQPLLSLLPELCQLFGLPYKHQRRQVNVPHRLFAKGSERPFADYVAGESAVNIDNIDDLIRWLISCKYGRDQDHFNTSDHWQHPQEFEQSKLGDCEDHALWAWRKLLELGLDAEFVVGRTPPSGDNVGSHAWVTYTENGEKYLLEATSKNRNTIVKQLVHTQESYFPHYSVNGRFETFQYSHFVLKHRGEKFLA